MVVLLALKKCRLLKPSLYLGVVSCQCCALSFRKAATEMQDSRSRSEMPAAKGTLMSSGSCSPASIPPSSSLLLKTSVAMSGLRMYYTSRCLLSILCMFVGKQRLQAHAYHLDTQERLLSARLQRTWQFRCELVSQRSRYVLMRMSRDASCAPNPGSSYMFRTSTLTCVGGFSHFRITYMYFMLMSLVEAPTRRRRVQRPDVDDSRARKNARKKVPSASPVPAAAATVAEEDAASATEARSAPPPPAGVSQESAAPSSQPRPSLASLLGAFVSPTYTDASLSSQASSTPSQSAASATPVQPAAPAPAPAASQPSQPSQQSQASNLSVPSLPPSMSQSSPVSQSLTPPPPPSVMPPVLPATLAAASSAVFGDRPSAPEQQQQQQAQPAVRHDHTLAPPPPPQVNPAGQHRDEVSGGSASTPSVTNRA